MYHMATVGVRGLTAFILSLNERKSFNLQLIHLVHHYYLLQGGRTGRQRRFGRIFNSQWFKVWAFPDPARGALCPRDPL